MIAKFVSRKLLMSIFSMMTIVYSVYLVKVVGYNYIETVVILPSIIVAISVICVAYVTGQAKIDVNQTVNMRGKND